MGRRLDGFDIELGFNVDGDVDCITYHDQEGCGHEIEFPPMTPIVDIVKQHLDHYARSHRMTPPRMCRMTIQVFDGPTLRCVREWHDTDEKCRYEM